jgi:predicted DNA-binding transcriptional regulator YafY
MLYEDFREILDKLQTAIRKKMVCIIYYQGEPGDGVEPGTRYIEPYALGISSKGNMVVRAWLIKGVSRTGKINPKLVPGWRLFKVNRIKTLDQTLEKFAKSRPDYNPEDEHMTKVITAAKF